MLNTKCSPEKVPEALKPFYEYLNDPKKNQASELTRMIDERVRKFNSSEWRQKYMTFEYILNEQKRGSEAIDLKNAAVRVRHWKSAKLRKTSSRQEFQSKLLLKIQDYPVKKSKNYRHCRVTRMAKTH